MKLFIFGSTGDLVKRKVIPAFIELGLEDLEIIALGRKDFTDELYEDFICKDKCFTNFKKRPKYYKIDFGDEVVCNDCEKFLDKDKNNFFYLAVPPKMTEKILDYIGQLKKEGYKAKILIEKPFGRDYKEAMHLKEMAIKLGLFKDILISDHYLFKEEVSNLQVHEFNKIKLVSLEKVGLEGRSGYYDEAGAIDDMIQSHFLNIIFNILKNPDEEFKDFKVMKVVRAQYGNGINKGYAKDLGKKSDTETFVNAIIKTKSHEYEFITGKKFDKKVGFIEADNKKILLSQEKNPYKNLFSDFFSQNKKRFSNINNSILAWKIIERIKYPKANLKYYPENTMTEEAEKI